LGLSDPRNGEVADLALARLSSSPGLETVDRQQLDAVLRELQLSSSGLVRAKDAVQAGKLLRADWFVLGSPLRPERADSIVLRIVDAHTGVVREAGMVRADHDPAQIASDLVAFVQQARNNAAQTKSPVYLGLSGFENKGINNRFVELPSQLRAYLTEAYQGSGVTLVEREFVEVLVQEIALDEAGLTDTNLSLPAAMQPAMWVVEGSFQSYETSRQEVEMILSVHHVFGKTRETALRAGTESALRATVKGFIDKTMRREASNVIFSRTDEAKWEIDIGRRVGGFAADPGGILWDRSSLEPGAAAIAKRNIEEAIRAFQSAVLLEPTNRQAQWLLASCFNMNFIGRVPEARELYRRLVDEGKDDGWDKVARQVLSFSWYYLDPADGAAWFENAERGATNALAAAFYHGLAVQERHKADAWSSGAQQVDAAKTALFDDLAGGLGSYSPHEYVRRFGEGKQAEAAARLTAMLPEIKTKFPNSYGDILAEIVNCQVNTNSPAVPGLSKSLGFRFQYRYGRKIESLIAGSS
jgi:curli biogenesis system outer membrane secretion channel CsgG